MKKMGREGCRFNQPLLLEKCFGIWGSHGALGGSLSLAGVLLLLLPRCMMLADVLFKRFCFPCAEHEHGPRL
ncbi:hypothetical protein VTJ04DRAFT_10058 [Mycothermus thermophilus]|uniref:uncharacterized protein n=1 Tax=Humicola insolens TaxID=85995 RepID=UPI00374265CE